MQAKRADAISKTFVLGAGFSVSAGFPLVRELKEQVIHLAPRLPYKPFFQPGNGDFEKGQFYAGLEAVDPDDSLQFEELLIALTQRLKHAPEEDSDPCHVTLIVLRQVCGQLLWNIQDRIQQVALCYKNFARWISIRGSSVFKSAIVSFNWDLLAEKALTDSGVFWSYTISNGSTIPILKPHGSINWSDYLRKNLKAEYRGWKAIGPSIKLSYDARNPLSNPDRDGINPDLRYMIFPGDPESAKEDTDLQLLWDWTAKVISEREAIAFIGYSLPQYDSFSADFFSQLSNGKIIEVYNPSEEHLEQFRHVFGNRIIRKQLKFEECEYGASPF
jgi:hypothetical protein